MKLLQKFLKKMKSKNKRYFTRWIVFSLVLSFFPNICWANDSYTEDKLFSRGVKYLRFGMSAVLKPNFMRAYISKRFPLLPYAESAENLSLFPMALGIGATFYITGYSLDYFFFSKK